MYALTIAGLWTPTPPCVAHSSGHVGSHALTTCRADRRRSTSTPTPSERFSAALRRSFIQASRQQVVRPTSYARSACSTEPRPEDLIEHVKCSATESSDGDRIPAVVTVLRHLQSRAGGPRA